MLDGTLLFVRWVTPPGASQFQEAAFAGSVVVPLYTSVARKVPDTRLPRP
jgi:hypothetical protein